MDIFNSLPLDLKILIVGIAGCALLALVSGSRKAEKRYALVLVVLTAAGIYRFTRIEQPETSAAPLPAPHVVRVAPKHTPLVSTSAK